MDGRPNDFHRCRVFDPQSRRNPRSRQHNIMPTPAHKHQLHAIVIIPIFHYEQKNNGEYLCWKRVDGWAPRMDRILGWWGHCKVSVKELSRRSRDLTRTNLRTQWRGQESESAGLQTGMDCRPPGTSMSISESLFVGRRSRSAHDFTGTPAQRPVLPDSPNMFSYQWIYRCKINRPLTVSELERPRMHQFVESAPTSQGSLVRSDRYYCLPCFAVSPHHALAHRVGVGLDPVPSRPNFVYRKILKFSTLQDIYAVKPFLLTSFTSGTKRTGCGSSQSGSKCSRATSTCRSC